MPPVTLLAHLTLVLAGFQEQRTVERMLRFHVLVARFTLDGSDMLLVWYVARIKAGMARNADQLLVRRMTQHFIIHEQRNNLPLALSRQGAVGVAGQTFFFRLRFQKGR